MTWSVGVGAWKGEGEEDVWAVISPAHPSLAGLRLGQGGWRMASS